ncbi:xanthine dehydrogenase family protein subunit M [Sesbania bispinosa]|nr:xanthine dehydrogenase family protein subunit M [Sesbania bispinosa]
MNPLLIAEYFTEASATSSSSKEPLHHNGGSLLVPTSTQLVSSSAHFLDLIAGSSFSEISAASTKSSSLFLEHEIGDNTTAKLEWKPSPVSFHFGSFESIQVEHQIPVAVSTPSNKVANQSMSA